MRDTSEIRKDVLTSNNDRTLFEELDILYGAGVTPQLHNCISPTMLIAMHRRDIPETQTIPVVLDAVVDDDGRYALRTSQFVGIDLDNFFVGCDEQISIDTEGIEKVMYVLNTYAEFIALKYFNVKGSAAIGEFVLSFANSNIGGSVGVNSSYTSDSIYKKTVEPANVSYSQSNCTFVGMIADYKKVLPYDILDNGTVVTGNNTPIDGDMTTDEESVSNNTTETLVWQIDLDNAIDIKRLHAFMMGKEAPIDAKKIYIVIDVYNGSWHEVYANGGTDTQIYIPQVCMVAAEYNNVTKIKVSTWSNTAIGDAYLRIYDMAVFV